jgi:hypothetical protein
LDQGISVDQVEDEFLAELHRRYYLVLFFVSLVNVLQRLEGIEILALVHFHCYLRPLDIDRRSPWYVMLLQDYALVLILVDGIDHDGVLDREYMAFVVPVSELGVHDEEVLRHLYPRKEGSAVPQNHLLWWQKKLEVPRQVVHSRET